MQLYKPGLKLNTVLDLNGFELDQRLRSAIIKSLNGISDGWIIRELLKSNPTSFSIGIIGKFSPMYI